MKRFLFIIPFILLLPLNACGTPPGVVPTDMGTAVGQTQTAAMWTPTITPTSTPDPNESMIVVLLNSELPEDNMLDRMKQLETAIGARYQVVDVAFTGENNMAEVFKVFVQCECATTAPCCSPERMFTVTMRAMEVNATSILRDVPETVRHLSVVCRDHGEQFAVLSVGWEDVKGFLRGEINGLQFGSRVTRGFPP